MSQNALVRLVYEAVDDPQLWDAFLTKFAEAVHAETAGLCTEDKAGQWGSKSCNGRHGPRIAQVL